jgi:hypothetical protein
MKKVYTYIIFLSLINAVMLRAQSISYDYVKNDPFDIKNFSFAIDPFFVDANGHNGYSFGWGLRAEHMMGKRLLMNLDMRTGFGTNHFRRSNKNTRNYFNLEGGLGLVFVNRVKVKNVPIILSQSTSGNIRTTLSIKGGVPAKSRLIVALRGGIINYVNTLDFKNLEDSLLTIDGMPYSQARNSYVFKDSSGATVKDIPGVGGISMMTVYGGLQFRTIRDLVIDVAGYGRRGNTLYSDFYVDVLFAPVINLRDLRSNGEKYDVKYGRMSHFGWRLGWFWRKPKEQGFSFKFEVGSRPGFKTPSNVSFPVNKKNLYCMLTMGLYIPMKVKPMYEGE